MFYVLVVFIVLDVTYAYDIQLSETKFLEIIGRTYNIFCLCFCGYPLLSFLLQDRKKPLHEELLPSQIEDQGKTSHADVKIWYQQVQ